MEKRQGLIMKMYRVVTGVLLAGLLTAVLGCNETHAEKKKAMVEQWEKSTASAQLPMIENMIEQGRIEEAKKAVTKSIEVDPESPQGYVLIGRIHAIEGRYDQARKAFETAVELDPESDQAWRFLGALATLEKDYEQALEHYKKALELMPANPEYLASIAEIYIEINQLEVALEVLERGLSMQPQNLQLMLLKARVHQQAGQTAQALRVYEQARIIHGDLPEVLEPAGYAYIAQRQYKNAAETFESLLKQYPQDDPRYHVTMRSLASCLFNSEQYGRALYWYDKLSVVYRDDADIRLSMAEAALATDDIPRAVYCATNALKVRPAWPKAYAVLGSAQYRQGCYRDSLNSFYKIADDDELGGFAWFMSGRCYQQLGQTRQANSAFEKAEQLDPENMLVTKYLKKTKMIHPL